MNPETLIRVRHLGVRFDDKEVLRDADLTVSRGDFIVLTGPNGGGKTTLLRILARLLEPSAGTVERAEDLRIGYLPQYRRIDRQFPITVHEVVLSGLHNRKPLFGRFSADDRKRVDALLAEISLTDLARRPISTLSGGQWQRVLLARAFVSQPDLLLMDEPDTHLDAATRSFLYDRLLHHAPDTAVVLVSHDAAFLSSGRTLRRYHVEDTAVRPLDD